MDGMFWAASSFDQDLCPWYDEKKGQLPFSLDMLLGSNCSFASDPNFETEETFCRQCAKVSYLLLFP
jgi:hypothetical protein